LLHADGSYGGIAALKTILFQQTSEDITMKFVKYTRSRPNRLRTDPVPLQQDDIPAKNTPTLAAIVASAVAQTSLALRARVLRRLLMRVGPLALAALAGGAFAKYVEYARWSRFSVSIDDAARVTSGQILELVRYVEQSNPTVLQQVMVVLSRDATTMAALGASVAALVMQLRSNRPWVRRRRQG
jgi:hypothetical protein